MLPNLRDLHHSTWCWLTTVFLNGRGLSNLMPNYSNLPIYQQFGIEMIGWQWILLGLWSWSIILIFISIDNLLHFGLILSLVESRNAISNFLEVSLCLSLWSLFSAQTKDDRKFLKKWKWSCVVMDEAHLLKDRSSFRSKKLRDIAHKAKMRLMLTGTPLQNDLQVSNYFSDN
jgi:hypothetical protein